MDKSDRVSPTSCRSCDFRSVNQEIPSVHAILPRMDNVPRLTKKQKKSLAFRERRKGKPPSSSRHEPEMDDTGLPAMENQDVARISSRGVEAWELAENAVHSRRKSTKAGERSGRRKADTGSSRQRPEENVGVVAGTKAKRKRQGDQESTTEGQKPKKRKTEWEHGDHVEGTESEEGEVKAQTKHRFILFLGTSLASDELRLHVSLSKKIPVGNLKYTTSRDDILQHFSACGQYIITPPKFLISHRVVLLRSTTFCPASHSQITENYH